MAKAKLSPLYLQLARVHRRMLWQSLVNTLAWFWAGSILLAAVWFLVQPMVVEQPPDWLRWVVAGGLLGLGTVLAVLVGALRAPSKLAAALSLDSVFGLKERVTTSLTLAPGQEATPAGQALLEDVNQRVRDLDVGSRFPLRMAWNAALVPVCAAVLAMIALFYQPSSSQATSASARDDKQPPANAADIEQKMKELAKKTNRERPPEAKPKSEEIERLEAELDKIAARGHGSKEEVRERLKEMTALEEQMKAVQKEMTEKSKALQQQLKRLDSLSQKDGEGPAKALEKALSEGKFDKAREEIERLNKRLQRGEMTAKEKQQLEKQLEKMKNKLDRMAKQKDKEEQLKKANLDPETLKREMNQLKKESQKLKDLQELADKLGKARQALKEGKMDSASESLSKAGEKMKEMQGDEQDLDDLRDQLKRLEDAKDAAAGGLDDLKGDPINADSDEPNDGGIGAGRRPEGKEKPYRSFDSRIKAHFDPKGKKIFDGYAPGQNFRSKTGAEMIGEIKQASQEAPEAIEQQRIPKAARDMARGYFERMRQQAEKEEQANKK
jgi:hypothetical protein